MLLDRAATAHGSPGGEHTASAERLEVRARLERRGATCRYGAPRSFRRFLAPKLYCRSVGVLGDLCPAKVTSFCGGFTGDTHVNAARTGRFGS